MRRSIMVLTGALFLMISGPGISKAMAAGPGDVTAKYGSIESAKESNQGTAENGV